MRGHILILGGGFSGVSAALSAALVLEKNHREDISITVISPFSVPSTMHGMDGSGLRKMNELLASLFSTSRIKLILGIANKV